MYVFMYACNVFFCIFLMGKYSCVCVYMEIVYVNVSEYVALQLDVYIYIVYVNGYENIVNMCMYM